MYNTKNLHTTHTCIYVGEKKCIYNDKTIMLINKTWQQQEDDQMLPSTYRKKLKSINGLQVQCFVILY